MGRLGRVIAVLVLAGAAAPATVDAQTFRDRVDRQQRRIERQQERLERQQDRLDRRLALRRALTARNMAEKVAAARLRVERRLEQAAERRQRLLERRQEQRDRRFRRGMI